MRGLMGPWLPTLGLRDPPAHICEYDTAVATAQNQLSPSLPFTPPSKQWVRIGKGLNWVADLSRGLTSELLAAFREGKCCCSLTPGQSGAGGKKVFKMCLV